LRGILHGAAFSGKLNFASDCRIACSPQRSRHAYFFGISANVPIGVDCGFITAFFGNEDASDCVAKAEAPG
jgi:hypothetical protein